MILLIIFLQCSDTADWAAVNASACRNLTTLVPRGSPLEVFGEPGLNPSDFWKTGRLNKNKKSVK